MKTGDGFVVVYSITSHSSFLDAANLKDQILRVKDADYVRGFFFSLAFLN